MKFYFFTTQRDYQHDVVSIAEGLEELGYSFSGNMNYWKSSVKSNYLIKQNLSGPQIGDVVIFSTKYMKNCNEFDQIVEKYSKSNILVGCDYSDRVYSRFYEKYQTGSPLSESFDLILKVSYNKNITHPKNAIPWAYGLTNRIINSTQNTNNTTEKIKKCLINFSGEQYTRVFARKHLISALAKYCLVDQNYLQDSIYDEYNELMKKQTGNRHNLKYYNQLLLSSHTLAVCGNLLPIDFIGVPDFMNFTDFVASLKQERIYSAINPSSEKLNIVQWDSFRFWEALASNSLPIHFNLEQYGVDLPIMPINGKHYLGLTANNFEIEIGEYFNSYDPSKNIDLRNWAINNYSPKAIAGRLIERIGALNIRKTSNTLPVSTSRIILKPFIKKKIILKYDNGQFGNRMTLFSHFLAYCIENGIKLENYSFYPYFKFFDRIVFDKIFDQRNIQLAFYYRIKEIIIKFKHLFFKQNYRVLHKDGIVKKVGMYSLLNDEVTNILNKNDVVIFTGWLFRYPVGVIKHSDRIRSMFVPKEKYRKQIVNNLSNLKGHLLIAVHIRLRDFRESKWHFEPEVYVEKMKQLSDEFELPLKFLVFSDEKLNEDAFRGLPVHFYSGEAIVDLYTMAGCDGIISTMSTFALSAAYLGRTPIFRISPENVDLNCGKKSFIQPFL